MRHAAPEETPLSCARALVLLEVFLDGELQGQRLSRFQAHLRSCTDCKGELEEARKIQEGLADLPTGDCPSAVTQRVLAWAAAREAPDERSRSRRFGGWGKRLAMIWRPAVAGLGVAVTALLIALAAREPARRVPQGTPQQVRAEQEARWALAYVARMTRRSSDQALGQVMDEVVDNVIGGTVVAPISEAVRRPLEEDGS